MPTDPFDSELDDLLSDLHKLLDEDGEPQAPAEAADPEDAPQAEPELPDLDALFADPDFAPEPPAPEPAPAPVPPQPPKKECKSSHWTQTQRLPRHVAKLQNNQEQAYADWLFEQDHQEPAQPQPVPKHPTAAQPLQYEELPDYEEDIPTKKKHHVLRTLLIVLLVLSLALTAVVVFLLPQQPKAISNHGPRKDGVSTILLAGTDAGGARTDTLMLLELDSCQRSLSLVSIPRDTLINGPYAVPKINCVYGVNEGGTEGMEMLLTRTEEVIGFRPDGLILIRLDAFRELVDAMGGVSFQVPVDMFYNDPSQDLYIDLPAGLQTLNGEQAMGVVRFRSGYADADLGRISVQRDFLKAFLDQAASPEGVLKAPMLMNILLDHTETTLSPSHFLWLARTALLADHGSIQTVTLPGTPKNFESGSYYVLDPASVAQTVNTYCNPYELAITVDDLSIRTS